MRACSTCQHLKRPEIDRRLAAGEPLSRIAEVYGLSQSSLYRHRKNCLSLGSSNAIKKEAARGSAAVALLPSAATLSGSYRELGERIDAIVTQAQQEGSLRIALSGLSSLRQTLDSLARLAAQEAAASAHGSSAQPNGGLDVQDVAERLIKKFDRQPELKAQIAAALLEMDEADAVPYAAGVEPNTPAAGNTGNAPTADNQTKLEEGPDAPAAAATVSEPRAIPPNTINDVTPAAGLTNSAVCATANSLTINNVPPKNAGSPPSNQISASEYRAQLAQFADELKSRGGQATTKRDGA